MTTGETKPQKMVIVTYRMVRPAREAVSNIDFEKREAFCCDRLFTVVVHQDNNIIKFSPSDKTLSLNGGAYPIRFCPFCGVQILSRSQT